MKCLECKEEVTLPAFAGDVKRVLVICPHCGHQMQAEPKPVLGFKWPKITSRPIIPKE